MTMRSSTLFRLLIVIMLVLTVLAVFQYFNVGNLLPLMVRRSPIYRGTPIYRGWPSPTPINRTAATITVNGTQWRYSTCYIGAVEGSSRFNIADLQDLGINTYHLYGGMSRWEAQDDDGIYGSPTID